MSDFEYEEGVPWNPTVRRRVGTYGPFWGVDPRIVRDVYRRVLSYVGPRRGAVNAARANQVGVEANSSSRVGGIVKVRKKPPVKRGKKGPHSMVKRAFKMIKEVGSQIETKFLFQQNTIDLSISDTGMGYCINGCYKSVNAQVADGSRALVSSGRIGNKIMVNSLNVRYYVSINTDSEEYWGCMIRVMIVVDRRPRGEAIDYSGYSVGGGVITRPTVLGSINNMNDRMLGRYLILYDKVHEFADVAKYVEFGKVFRKLRLPVWYSGNTNTYFDIDRNTMWLCALRTLGPGNEGGAYVVTYEAKAAFQDA